MKMFVLSSSIVLTAFIICISIFFNKRNIEIISKAKQNDKSKSLTVSATKTTSNDLPIDFAPTKENLINITKNENDVQSEKAKSAIAKKEEEKPQSANYGLTTGVAPQANAQVASVAEALKDKNHPERLSPLIQPKPFDRAKFEKDPEIYLNTIEPGRVFQSKNPDSGVIAIQRISEPFVTIQQKDQTVLKVKALPLMPVSFTSFDLGAFQNKLTAITVQADKEGFAQATFIATEGTIAECKILASCPETSGNIKFVITIQKNNLFGKEN